jgi:hypothetical protein
MEMGTVSRGDPKNAEEARKKEMEKRKKILKIWSKLAVEIVKKRKETIKANEVKKKIMFVKLGKMIVNAVHVVSRKFQERIIEPAKALVIKNRKLGTKN